jgi:WbqC-like protein family
MQRIVCAHQPPFLPWLGIVESMLVCDVFCILDDVQFERAGWQNRNEIKTPNGREWLTVPVVKKGRFGQIISEVEISTTDFKPLRMWRTIDTNYGKARFFSVYKDAIADLILRPAIRLIDFDMRFLEYLKNLLNAKCQFVYSSDLGIGEVSKTLRPIRICQATGCETLYSGSGAKVYMDESEFARSGLRVIWHDYEKRHAQYQQQFMRLGFTPCLSFVDYLFNCGAVEMRRVLLESGRAKTIENGMIIEEDSQLDSFPRVDRIEEVIATP